MVFRLLENALVSQKIESRKFTIGFYHDPPSRGKLHIPQGQRFLKIYPQQLTGRKETILSVHKCSQLKLWPDFLKDTGDKGFRNGPSKIYGRQQTIFQIF